MEGVQQYVLTLYNYGVMDMVSMVILLRLNALS